MEDARAARRRAVLGLHGRVLTENFGEIIYCVLYVLHNVQDAAKGIRESAGRVKPWLCTVAIAIAFHTGYVGRFF